MIRIPKFAKNLLSLYIPNTLRSMSGKPSLLLLALFLASPIISCAGRDTDEPAVNTGAVTPGASVSAGGEKGETNVASISTKTGTDADRAAHPLEHVAPSSHDSDSWFLVTDVKAERKFTVYVDTSTIDTIDGEVYSWSRLVFDEDQKDSDGLVYREVLIASAIDCAANTYAYKSSKFYDSLGKMVYMENVGTNKSKIPENSVSHYIADFVCGYKPKDTKVVNPAPPPASTEQRSK
jgi:Surface-adhesin protein E